MAGQLFIIGTPIGNLGDMTARGVETLRSLDVLYCEDTRVTGKLLAHFMIQIPTRALSDDAAQARVDEAVAEVRAGKRVGFSTDAGMPGISDPARRLTTMAWEAGIVPSVIPGASALSTLLAACPFVDNSFCFAGFAPRKSGELKQFAQRLRDADEPQVFFDSPRRVHDTLSVVCATVEPERQVLIGREMTKLHEQFVLFTAGEWNSVAPRLPELGEYSVAVARRTASARSIEQEEAVAAMARLEAAGFSQRDAARALAAVMEIGVNQIKKLAY